MYFYDNDTDPVYSLAHVADHIVVDATSGRAELRQILGGNFVVKDSGSLSQEGSKLDVLDEFSPE